MATTILTAQRVRELLDFSTDPPTRRVQTSNSVKVGEVAGTFSGRYRQIHVEGRIYKGHRLVWLATYGEWPKGEIDHIDGNPSNNRIENLRDVTRRVNQENMRRPRADNKSCGLLGVSRNGKDGWTASIMSNHKHHYLGTFRTPEDAHAAYLAAKRRLHEGCTI